MTTLNTTTLAQVQLQQVIEQLNQLADWQLINIYTNYADENRYEDIHDLSQDTINDLFESPWDAITKSNHDGFNENDSYFVFNGYGLMSTFTSLDSDNSPIDIEELAQWIVDNDLFNEYDIEVTTLGDMLASIEDNINDDGYILSKLADYLGQSLNDDKVELLKTDNEYYEYLVSHFMNELDDYSYSDLYDLINTVGINYSVN